MKRPIVSVIVPNFNHGKFLPVRLNTIFNQTFQDFELILLDDASRDNSEEILQKYASHPKVTHFEVNKINSGSSFYQWKKGIELTKGEYIWIAESDDYSTPDFLEKILAHIRENDSGIIYSQSIDVNEKGEKLQHRKNYTSNFQPNIWESDFTLPGKEFNRLYLKQQNVIPNASAVVFKRSLVNEDIFTEDLLKMKMLGDWLFWIKLCEKTNLGFISEPLNFFREHSGVTRKHIQKGQKKTRLVEETRVRKYLGKISGVEQQVEVVNLYQKWSNLHGIRKLGDRNFYKILARRRDLPLLVKTLFKTKMNAR